MVLLLSFIVIFLLLGFIFCFYSDLNNIQGVYNILLLNLLLSVFMLFYLYSGFINYSLFYFFYTSLYFIFLLILFICTY